MIAREPESSKRRAFASQQTVVLAKRTAQPVKSTGCERAHFPGENAGASLKHNVIALHLSPGFFHFPGENAGASLKLEVGHQDVQLGPEHFPGENAGASLKRISHRLRHVQRQRGISPEKMPGPH